MAGTPSTLRAKFSARLREARIAADLSQRALGRRIGLSEEVVSSRITRYERGTSEPDFDTVEKLAKQLGVPVAYLVADNEILAEIILAAAALPLSEQRKLVAELKARKK